MQSPIVLLPACTRNINTVSYHTVQAKYVGAVVNGARCAPLILPALGDQTDWDAVLAAADGILLTGSPSNVHPSHFRQTVRNEALPLDRERDATTLPLIRAALGQGIPLLAICRGAQEVNVALGGTLHQAVHEVPGMMDHREDESAPYDQQYAPVHPASLTPGGVIARILGSDGDIMINSLHGQGIDMLAPGLSVEARAPDGLIEAYSVSGAPALALALQWHPEWRIADNPVSQALFAAFGNACRQYRQRKRESGGEMHEPPQQTEGIWAPHVP